MRSISRAECYTMPTHGFTGQPRREAKVAGMRLHNLRPFPDWRGGRFQAPKTPAEADLRLLSASIRDGGGFAGRPEGDRLVRDGLASPATLQTQADHINDLVARAPRGLWLAFIDSALDDSRQTVPVARFQGVVINEAYPGPRYQPLVYTPLGATALVPNTYRAGWLHVEL